MSTRGLPRTVGDLPWMGRPALSALLAVDIDSLQKVSALSRDELAAMHGVDPRAVAILADSLAEKGLTFRE